MALQELRAKLPNNLPGSLINAFLFHSHWCNLQEARKFWIELKPKNSVSILNQLSVFARLFNMVGDRIKSKRGSSFSISFFPEEDLMIVTLYTYKRRMAVTAATFSIAEMTEKISSE